MDDAQKMDALQEAFEIYVYQDRNIYDGIGCPYCGKASGHSHPSNCKYPAIKEYFENQ